MNVVFIVPTGLGAEIGGHAGDATPAAKLIASVCDTLISHPNVFNASDINEMPANALYVEGSMLDRFLEGKIGLERVVANKILVAVNSPITPEIINAVSAARATIGIDASIIELKTPLLMEATKKNGLATGEVSGWMELVEQVQQHSFDALAISSGIDCDGNVALEYLRAGGVNPWGGVEAVASKLISDILEKPVAHAPTESETMKFFNEIVDSRMAAETVSIAYLHCVLKGLHKAPQIGKEIMRDSVQCLVTADGCCGPPHWACIDAGIPIIVVRENQTVGNNPVDPDQCIMAENYLEAAGMVAAMGEGISLDSIRRPLEPTKILAE